MYRAARFCSQIEFVKNVADWRMHLFDDSELDQIPDGTFASEDDAKAVILEGHSETIPYTFRVRPHGIWIANANSVGIVLGPYIKPGEEDQSDGRHRNRQADQPGEEKKEVAGNINKRTGVDLNIRELWPFVYVGRAVKKCSRQKLLAELGSHLPTELSFDPLKIKVKNIPR